MANILQLSDKGPDGVLLGQSSTDKIGFYGLTTPIVRPSVATAITTGATETATISLVRSIRLALVSLGLVG
jgi:hypothetical protein